MKEQRVAFKVLETNALARSLPRHNGLEPSLRKRRFFGSTSQTPKVSNCALGPTEEKTREHPYAAGNVTTRRRKRSSHDKSTRNIQERASHLASPVVGHTEKLLSAHAHLDGISSGRNEGPIILEAGMAQPCRKDGDSSKKTHDEDMQLSSGDSVDLSSTTPEGSPPLADAVHYKETPRSQKTTKAENDTSSGKSCRALSPKMSRNLSAPFRPIYVPGHRCRLTAEHRSTELTGDCLKGIRDTPADDPHVLSQVLYGGDRLMGVEIGGEDLQQDSATESDLTASTIGAPNREVPNRKAPDPWTATYLPRQSPVTEKMYFQAFENSGKRGLQDHEAVDDYVEEWSLPDEEIKASIEFKLDGKQYIHRPLPPGWKIQISKSHKRPFYHHPDHGTTWHCPVVLKSKSEALRLRKSSFGTQEDLSKGAKTYKETERSRQPLQRPDKLPVSPEETMSDVVKICIAAAEEYDGSVSSCHSTETHSSASTFGSNKPLSVTRRKKDQFVPPKQQEPQDWMTPLRCDMTTPAAKYRRPSSAKQSSTHKLSPIDEEKARQLTGLATFRNERLVAPEGEHYSRLDTPANLTRSKALAPSFSEQANAKDREAKRSTPRVSYEAIEIDRKAATSVSNQPLSTRQKIEMEAKQAPLTPSPNRPTQWQKANGTQKPASPKPKKLDAAEASTPISDTDGDERDTNAVETVGNQTRLVEVGLSRQLNRVKRKSPTAVANTPSGIMALVSVGMRHTSQKRKSIILPSVRKTPNISSVAFHKPAGGSFPKNNIPMAVGRHATPRQNSSCIDRTSNLKHDGRDIVMSSGSIGLEHSASSIKSNVVGYNILPEKETGRVLDECLQPQLDFQSISDTNKTPVQTEACFSPSSTSNGSLNEEFEQEDNNGSHYSPQVFTPVAVPQQSSHSPSPISKSLASQPSHGKSSLTSQSTVPSKISFTIASRSSDDSTVRPHLVDVDGINEPMVAPPAPKRINRTFGWRVLYPYHPFCSLQKIDALLREQQKYKPQSSRSKARTRATGKKRVKPRPSRKRQPPRVHKKIHGTKRPRPRKR